MLFISILILIVAMALHSNYIHSILITRIAAITFIYAGALSLNAFYIQSIGSGIGIYSGLFHVTSLLQFIEVFFKQSYSSEFVSISYFLPLDTSILEDLYNKLENLEPIPKIVVSIILLNSVKLVSITSIIFIYYGEYILKILNIENRYPKLANIIKLRRKLQSYNIFFYLSMLIFITIVEALLSLFLLYVN